jgi:hypothetical protein
MAASASVSQISGSVWPSQARTPNEPPSGVCWPFPDEALGLQRLGQLARLGPAFIDAGVQHQQGEFVAAQPADGVRFAQMAQQHPRHRHQGRVARRHGPAGR